MKSKHSKTLLFYSHFSLLYEGAYTFWNFRGVWQHIFKLENFYLITCIKRNLKGISNEATVTDFFRLQNSTTSISSQNRTYRRHFDVNFTHFHVAKSNRKVSSRQILLNNFSGSKHVYFTYVKLASFKSDRQVWIFFFIPSAKYILFTRVFVIYVYQFATDNIWSIIQTHFIKHIVWYKKYLFELDQTEKF